MKLIRKQNAPIVIDEYGVAHPELTLKIVGINEDKLNKKIVFICKYFHTVDCNFNYLSRMGDAIFEFSNTYVNTAVGSLGWPTYTQVKEDVEIDEDGNLIPLNNDMADWLINQRFVLDCEGKPFGDNWELTN